MSAAECGTIEGYRLHIKRREPTCAPCREANRIHIAERRTDDDVRAAEKLRNSARSKALARLGRENRERFRQLYHDELTKAKETSR